MFRWLVRELAVPIGFVGVVAGISVAAQYPAQGLAAALVFGALIVLAFAWWR